MTRLTLTFASPGPVSLVGGESLVLSFPAPQAVELQVQGIQGPAAGGGGGATNLAWVAATSSVTSDTGTDATLTVADGANPGLMTSADFTKLAALSGTNTGDQTSIVGITGTKAQFDTAVTDGNIMYVGDAPTAHTHLLAAVTDVTMTVANLNSLDDGADTTLHFHAADRARANHTGTQAAGTITGLAAVATSGSASDLGSGTLPAARFDDTAHGARAGGTLHANVIAAGAAGFMTGADKTKLDGIAAGAQVNVATDLAYTAATRLLASSTGADATLPLVVAAGDAGLMTGADKTKLDGIATGATANATDASLQLASTISNFAATVIASVLTGFTVAGSRTAIVATDTILAAFGKVQKYLNDLSALAFSGSAADLTGTKTATFISDFSEAVDDRVAVLAVAGTNMTVTYNDAAGTLTFDAAGGGAGTNLSYTAATRIIASDTGTDATLPLVTSGDAGLAPASGGGTTNFLRADGTWAAPGGGSITVQDEGVNITTALSTLNFVGAGVTVTGGATATVTIPSGGGGLSDGNYGDVTVSGTGTVITLNPKIKHGLPRAMGRSLFF
jgi:hypothetical protein